MSSALTVVPEFEVQEFADPSSNLQARARALRIVDQATFEEAGAIRRDAKSLMDAITRKSDPVKQQLHKTHRDFIALVCESTDPLQAIEDLLKPACDRYVIEERKRREEAQRAADEKARLEREEVEKIAAEAVAKGDVALAAYAQEEAHKIESAPAPRVAPVHSGNMRIPDVWDYEVEDLDKFLLAIIEKRVPREAIELTPMVRATAKRLKDKFDWDGLKPVSRPSTGRR